MAVASSALALASGTAAACEHALGADARVAEDGGFRLAYRTDPTPVPVGEPFAVLLAVCATGGGAPPERIAVDAWMPAHGHGMNYRPTVTREAPGRFRAEGLLFHMPGRWDLRVEIATGASPVRLSVPHAVD